MQNIGCCPPFDKTREIVLFGKKLSVKNYGCSPDGVHYAEKPEPVKIGLSISPTAFCPANCRFCLATGTKKHTQMDMKKLETVLTELKKADRVLYVSFTGGEPFYDVALLDEAVSMVFEILGKETEVSISTNGMGLAAMHRLRYLSYIDAIHISRHHYDDGLNDEIFGRKMPTAAELKAAVHSVRYRDIFVFNCMLQRDYIGTSEQAHRFLNFAIDLGVPKVSFITCTPVNAYAREQRVTYETVLRRDDPSLLFTRGFRDFAYCHCDDGIYRSPAGDLIEFYGRTTTAVSCDYCRGLSYGADSILRSGYTGELII